MSPKIIKPSSERDTGSSPKIIEKEVLLAHDEARRIVERAEARAREIEEQARADAEAVLQQAEKEGHERSLADWQSRMARLAEARQELLAQARPQVLQLAVRVAEKILRRQIETDPEALHRMVRETLDTVRAAPGQQIVLRVHPDDRDTLEQLRQRLVQRNRRWESLAVEADDALSRGGCRVESEYGTLDAGIETQLRAIEKLLLEGES